MARTTDTDALLTAIDNETPVSADDFRSDMVYVARASWCNLSYKGRYEEAADQLWDYVDEIGKVLGADDATLIALTILDIVAESDEIEGTQAEELADLREWVERNGGVFNFRRALRQRA